jgi:hypothetical protein
MAHCLQIVFYVDQRTQEDVPEKTLSATRARMEK